MAERFHILSSNCLFTKYIFLCPNSVTKTRLDFLRVVALKYYKDPNDAINYLKKYSIAADATYSHEDDDFTCGSTQYTDTIIVQAIKEIRSFYPMKTKEKFTLIAKLLVNVIFLSGWLFYVWGFATDVELLYKSYGCVSGK